MVNTLFPLSLPCSINIVILQSIFLFRINLRCNMMMLVLFLQCLWGSDRSAMMAYCDTGRFSQTEKAKNFSCSHHPSFSLTYFTKFTNPTQPLLQCILNHHLIQLNLMIDWIFERFNKPLIITHLPHDIEFVFIHQLSMQN